MAMTTAEAYSHQPVQDPSTMAIYQLNYDGVTVNDESGLPFDAKAYSEFKYGAGDVTDRYAYLLALRLINRGSLADTYISSSAYKNVPTAAYHITQRILSNLAMMGSAPAGVFKIDRNVVFDHDYASLSHEERAYAMRNNGLGISPVVAAELQGKEIVVIDDIKITGRHEEALRRQLGSLGLNDVLFGYVAVLDPAVAYRFPAIENMLNSTAVKTLDDLIPIIESGNFYLNARTCKFILKQSPESIYEFIQLIPQTAAEMIVSSVISDGYNRMENFKEQFSALSMALVAKTQQIQRLAADTLPHHGSLTVIK